MESELSRVVDALPALVWTASLGGEIDFLNQQWSDYTGFSREASYGKGWQATVHPDELDETVRRWDAITGCGKPGEMVVRLRRCDGAYRRFLMRVSPLADPAGQVVKWCGVSTDIESTYLPQTDIDNRKRAEALLSGEKRLLEMVARGLPLVVVLDVLCELVEGTMGPCYCSILLVDATAGVFRQGAAPSLPPVFNAAFDGMKVDPADGTCGMAVVSKTQVIAADVATDPRWVASPWSGLMAALDLRSCWSTPILSGDRTVLGVLAIYQHGPETPTARQHDLIEQFTIIAGIAIERALNDAALTHSEARKAAILDSALDCIITIDHEGCITEFNPAAERTFARRREDVMGKRLGDIIVPPLLREAHRLGMERYLATGDARVIGRRVEMTAMRADGSEFPVELTVTRIVSDGPPSFTGYLRDITERTISEENLRRSEAYLAKAQTLSRTGSFGWKVATEEHFWSDETFRIFEYDRSTPISLQAILQRVHPLDVQLVTQVVALAANGSDFDYECRLLMPRGEVKYVHIVAHGTRSSNGDLEYIGAVQDVTEQRLSEEALAALRTELAHVARVTSLGTLTASIAHEVNQPLSGIITNASTCLRMLAADPPNINGARETARRTIRDGNRASDVVSRLRALFSKKEATTEPVDLNEAAKDVIALSLRELQRGQVIVRAELADALPPVTGDRVQLQQVILNLLLNAADAMSGVEDRPRQLVVRTVREDDLGVRVTVQDSGVGFDPNTAEKLFEAFYTTKTGGMGIGLSVSRSIILSHRGRLWATANDGPGAAFSFSIPGIAEAAPIAAPTGIGAGSSSVRSENIS